MAADEVILLDLTIKEDIDGTEKKIEDLTSSIEGNIVARDKLREEIKRGTKTQNEGSKELAKIGVQLQQEKRQRNDLIKVMKTEKGSRDQLRLTINKLIKQRNSLNLTTKEGKKRAEQLRLEINKLDKVLQKTGTTTEKAKGNIGKYSTALKGLASNLGIAFGAGAILKGAQDILRISVELDTLRRKSKTVFGDYFKDIEEFAKQNAISMGQTKGEFIAAASAIGDLLIPMGFTREAASQMTLDITSLSGALSEWSGGTKTATEVNEILTKALLGEREQLKTLGISIKEVDIQQRLLEKGQKGLTGTALEQAKAQASLELIYEKTSDAQTAYANNSDSLIRQQQELGATFRQLKESLAEALIPELNELSKSLNDNVNVIKDKTLPLWQRLALVGGKQLGIIKDLGEAQKEVQRQNEINNETQERANQLTDEQTKQIEAQLPLLADIELQIRDIEAARKGALTEEDLALANRELQLLKDRLAELQKIGTVTSKLKTFEDDYKETVLDAAEEIIEEQEDLSVVYDEIERQRVEEANNELDRLKKIDKQTEESASLRKRAFLQTFDSIKTIANDTFKFLQDQNKARLDARLEDERLSVKQRERLEKDFAKKSKKLAITQAIINGSLAILKTLASVVFPLNLIAAATTAVATGIQIATIKNAQFKRGGQVPIAKRGIQMGTFQGASHSGGGIDIMTSEGKPIANVEGNENFYVVNKNASDFINSLSSINQRIGGGVPLSNKRTTMQDGGQAVINNQQPGISINDLTEEVVKRLPPIFTKVVDIKTGLEDRQEVINTGIV